MRYEDLNWFDIQEYLKTDDRLILIIGACEQHGYLSLLTDVKIPQALADSVSEQTGVVIAPALNFGSSPYFLCYPGTISLRLSTLLDIIEDLILSVYEQGFRRVLILNGHAGNDGARMRLYEIQNKLDDLMIRWYSWWESHSVQKVALDNNLKPAHGNWLEAFSFTTVEELPVTNKVPPKVFGLLSAEETKKVYRDGVFGGKYTVDNTVMEMIFSSAKEDILNLLNFD